MHDDVHDRSAIQPHDGRSADSTRLAEAIREDRLHLIAEAARIAGRGRAASAKRFAGRGDGRRIDDPRDSFRFALELAPPHG